MADYALAVQCLKRSSFATEHFQRKQHKHSDLHAAHARRGLNMYAPINPVNNKV